MHDKERHLLHYKQCMKLRETCTLCKIVYLDSVTMLFLMYCTIHWFDLKLVPRGLLRFVMFIFVNFCFVLFVWLVGFFVCLFVCLFGVFLFLFFVFVFFAEKVFVGGEGRRGVEKGSSTVMF